MTPSIVSWSGGKDSCFACYKALGQGYRVERLVNFISPGSKRCCFHGLPASVLELQAGSLGIPLTQHEVGPDMATYETEFTSAISRFKASGTEAMVFGDIYLDEHKNWVDRVCATAGLRSVLPLWGKNPAELIRDFLALGFKTMIISCRSELMEKEYIGRIMDAALVDELIARGICPCAENGEFHTLVVDGPIFKKRLQVQGVPVFKEGFWPHWGLDIRDCSAIKKNTT